MMPVRIAVVGPDGVGKSTAITAVTDWFHTNAPEVAVEIRQWRPTILPDLGRFLGKPPQPTTKNPPRRTPGRFHWLRISYYLVDFVAGTWWKDFVRAAPSSLIIYDRCALDMFVDPVRFALRSQRGTRLINALTPGMDAVILLHDSPRRISERKQELAPHEMAEQLNTWLQLVDAGEVTASIRVDAGAAKISARLLDVVLGSTGAVLRAPEPPPLRDGAGGSLEHLGAGSYLPFPSATNPRFLIPVSNRRTMSSALEIYNAQAVLARVGKALLQVLLRTGLAPHLMRSRVEFPSHGGESLLNHLADALVTGPLTCSVSAGTPNLSQKPVLQLMDATGRIAGYAKIGWNERTIELVKNERRTLEALAGLKFTTAILPRVLHAGPFRDQYVLVESAPQTRTKQAPASLGRRHLEFLIELHRQGEGVEASLWSKISQRLPALERLGFHYPAHLIEQAIGDQSVRTGFGHGDFAGWNLRLENEKLLVLDWEYGSTQCPPLWDLLHFEIRSAIELDKQSAASICRKLMHPGTTREAIEEYCDPLKIPGGLIQPLITSYVSDALSANLLLHGNLPSPKDATTRATLANMLAILCRPQDYAA